MSCNVSNLRVKLFCFSSPCLFFPPSVFLLCRFHCVSCCVWTAAVCDDASKFYQAILSQLQNLDGACIQSVNLVIDEDQRMEITLSHVGEVFMSGQYRISLPYSDGNALLFLSPSNIVHIQCPALSGRDGLNDCSAIEWKFSPNFTVLALLLCCTKCLPSENFPFLTSDFMTLAFCWPSQQPFVCFVITVWEWSDILVHSQNFMFCLKQVLTKSFL